jgi:hypothetical protein
MSDPKREFGIDRIQARELPDAPVVKLPDWQKTIVQEKVSKDKMYGKKFDPPTMKAKRSWTFRRKLARGASVPAKGSK